MTKRRITSLKAIATLDKPNDFQIAIRRATEEILERAQSHLNEDKYVALRGSLKNIGLSEGFILDCELQG